MRLARPIEPVDQSAPIPKGARAGGGSASDGSGSSPGAGGGGGDGGPFEGIRAWVAYVSSDAVRARRVCVLVLAFAALGVADLVLTLSYMGGIGLFEGNPLARALVIGGGASTLAAFKLLTIALSAVILFGLRTKRSAELGAWLCVIVMSVVSLEWRKYSAAADEIVLALQVVDSPFCVRDNFVSLKRN